jgi:hypothetical protein
MTRGPSAHSCGPDSPLPCSGNELNRAGEHLWPAISNQPPNVSRMNSWFSPKEKKISSALRPLFRFQRLEGQGRYSFEAVAEVQKLAVGFLEHTGGPPSRSTMDRPPPRQLADSIRDGSEAGSPGGRGARLPRPGRGPSWPTFRLVVEPLGLEDLVALEDSTPMRHKFCPPRYILPGSAIAVKRRKRDLPHAPKGQRPPRSASAPR